MIRPIRALTAAVVLLAGAGLAACGIDEEVVFKGATPTTNADGSDGTTTTEDGGPDISLPDIPPDVTEPDSTVPDPTQPDETVPDGETTPGGLTVDGLASALTDEGLTDDQASCVAEGVFATMDPDTIDELFSTDDVSDVDPEVFSQFEEVVQTCVQGG